MKTPSDIKDLNRALSRPATLALAAVIAEASDEPETMAVMLQEAVDEVYGPVEGGGMGRRTDRPK